MSTEKKINIIKKLMHSFLQSKSKIYSIKEQIQIYKSSSLYKIQSIESLFYLFTSNGDYHNYLGL